MKLTGACPEFDEVIPNTDTLLQHRHSRLARVLSPHECQGKHLDMQPHSISSHLISSYLLASLQFHIARLTLYYYFSSYSTIRSLTVALPISKSISSEPSPFNVLITYNSSISPTTRRMIQARIARVAA